MSSIDTILAHVTNDAALTAVTVAAGDSLTVRSFAPPSLALLDDVTLRGGAAAAEVRITSPYLHDTTRGITLTSAQSPAVGLIPRNVAQFLASQDTLDVSATSGAADSTVIALHAYYTDLGASNARLHSWGDVGGLIKQVKPLECDAEASATIGAWNDVALTTTENLLKANTDYAVLGYVLDTECAVVGIRGQDTGSLRITGPGSTDTNITSDYFVRRANETGRPYIPVINAANAGNTSVSLADNAASTAVKVQLILAELSQNLSS